MDQIKIGKFIAERRKQKNLTQMQLAEKLGLTDRAVSKWECGRSLPDSAIMLDLCDLLGITVNELLSGEELNMENKEYNKQIEQNLIEMVKQKEAADKRLLRMEIVICVASIVFLAAMVAVGSMFVGDAAKQWIFFVLLGVGFVQLIVCAMFALRVEQVAGYYECRKCGHKYVPSYGKLSAAMHMGRTRYMKCPHCGQWSWQKKVVKKDDENTSD